MQRGFELGTVTNVDVLNALRDQYQAERELQTARYEHIKYLLQLKREAGVLSADDILEVGGWLIQPTVQ
jgi:outer membrane protein